LIVQIPSRSFFLVYRKQSPQTGMGDDIGRKALVVSRKAVMTGPAMVATRTRVMPDYIPGIPMLKR
jgi:hypothetical protein